MALLNHTPFDNIHSQLDSSINPYVSMVESNDLERTLAIFHGEKLKGAKGNWREQFSAPPKKHILEIGCHLGATLCDYAELIPDYGFIGVDVTFKRVVTAAQRARQRGLDNVLIAMFNAKFIEQIFENNELDDVLVFFPDPWEKRRQRKHRLFSQGFIEDLYKVTKSGGGIWFKTDHKNYSNEVAKAFFDSSFRLTASNSLVHKYQLETTFQRKFRLQGKPYYEYKWSKI